MKRINIILSDELVEKLEAVSRKKELSVAEIARRSLEIYLQRFPEKPVENVPLPAFDFGKLRVRDFKQALYNQRIKEILD